MPLTTPFKVSHSTWLDTEAERIKNIILVPKYWHRAWTKESLKETLADIGLEYSMQEIAELNDKLHLLGIVEDVGQP